MVLGLQNHLQAIKMEVSSLLQIKKLKKIQNSFLLPASDFGAKEPSKRDKKRL
jgi:hypothetical protein